MKKVISFSLWGSDPTYTIGAIKNAELAPTFYPDFECWFYVHEDTVPRDIIESLQQTKNTKVILKNGDLNYCKPMMWRFEAIDDPEVEIMISRDTDTRFLLREKLAVDEWLNSGKRFHIMRDHPHHAFKILAGMFGAKKIPSIPNWLKIIEDFKSSKQNQEKLDDQIFLANDIYPLIKDDVLIHANFHKYEGEFCLNFPIQYDNEFHFVGEYVYSDESRSERHTNALKDSL